MADIKLKPCPFCGGEARIIRGKYNNIIYNNIVCHECQCSSATEITSLNGKPNRIISAWNRRVNNG